MIIKSVTLDSKGRVYLSKGERTGLGTKVLIAKSRDRFLFLTEEEFDSILTKELVDLEGLELRRKQRILCAGVFRQKIDKQGRVVIPVQLREEMRK